MKDNIGLVRTFYDRMRGQKLPHDGYLTQRPSWQAIRDEIIEICDRIGSLRTIHNIDFPSITHFITKDKHIQGKAIFQSNYSLVNQPIFLHDHSARLNSFELITDTSGKSAFVLLDIVTRAVKDIVRLFRRLEMEHEDIYPELLRQCFGNTDYLDEIRRVKQIGWRHEWCETNYGHLLTNGFGLYEVRTNRSQLTDPEEVEIRYLSMNNSPEAIMREMCQKHLVFGLSATAHINRTLRNFDWAGLAHPLTSEDSFQPLPLTSEDQADIDRANRDKAAIRNNTIEFEVAEPLSLSSSFGQQLEAIANRSGDIFGSGEQKDQRLKRTRHFFGLLSWVAQRRNSQHATGNQNVRQTHLVFLSSVKQVGYLLGNIKADEDGWFKASAKVLPDTLSELQLYDLTYRDEQTGHQLECHIILYDARFGQALRKDLALEQQYNALFWDGKPVIVVTTYPSAGNGVNLQYYLNREDYEAGRSAGKRDFIHLHLLDSPYFYFGKIEREKTSEHERSILKTNVYGIMKLLHAKHISEAQAIGQLNHIRAINLFNKTYLTLPDGILNQFSVFVQAIGRIERVWQPTENQVLRLDKGAYQVFERILVDENLAIERQNYLRFASFTMQSLLTTLEKHAQIHRDTVEDELLDISRADQHTRQAIHQMVMDIQLFRRTGKPADIRDRWQKLREDVLKHNMLADSIKQIGGVFQTDYVNEGKLYINKQGQIAPPSAHSYEFEPWLLNGIYRPLTIIHNTVLTNYFRVRGYELSFLNSGRCFLPYIYQAILTGAIGEEATQAILRMKGIHASSDSIPDQLFEVADLRIEERPIFIDCKNYGTQTLRQFALPSDDPLHRPKLNEPYFKERMIEKWQLIQQYFKISTIEPCRLIVFNLVDDDEGALRYYNAAFDQVYTWEQARIIVLTGALKRQPEEAKDLLTTACHSLLTQLL